MMIVKQEEATGGGDLREDPGERDWDAYRVLVDLWSKENAIKTAKLQMLLAVNAMLVAAIAISGGVPRDKWLVYLAGAVFGVIWTLSIGRTCLFQDIWQIKLAEIRGRHLDDPRFAVLETAQTKEQARGMTGLLGRVPSKWYLLLSPLGFTVVWLWLFFLSL